MIYEQGRNKWYQSGRTSDCSPCFVVLDFPGCGATPFPEDPSLCFSSTPDMVSTNQLDFRDISSSPVHPPSRQASGLGFDGMLVVTISNCIYPISEDVLHQIFDPYGVVTKISIHVNYPTVKALIYFASYTNASFAKYSLDGRNVYDDCCQLSIQIYMPDKLPKEVLADFNVTNGGTQSSSACSSFGQFSDQFGASLEIPKHWVGQTLDTKKQRNLISHSEISLDVAIPPTQHLIASNISIEKETQKLLDSKLSLEVEQLDSFVNDPEVIVRSTEARGLTPRLQIIGKPKKQRKKRQHKKIKRHQLDFDYWHYKNDDDMDDLDSSINDGLDFEPLDDIILRQRSIKLSEYICDGNSNKGVALFPQVEEHVGLCSDATDEIKQETFFSGYSVAYAQIVIDGSHGFSKDYNFGSFNDDNEPGDFDYEGPCAVEDMFDPNSSFYFSAFNLNQMKFGIHSFASDVYSLEFHGAVSPNSGNGEVDDVIFMIRIHENAPVFTIVNGKAIGESDNKLKTFKVLIEDSMAQISKPFDYVGLFVKTAWFGNGASSFSKTKLENLLKFHQIADGTPPSLFLYNKKNEITFIANRHILVFDPGDSYVISLMLPFEDSLMVVFSFGHDYVFPYRNPWGQGLFLDGGNSRTVRVALQRDDETLVVVDSLIGEKAYVELGIPMRFRELKLSLMFFVEFSGVLTIAYLKVAERGFDCKVDGYSETILSNSVIELHCFMESNRNACSRDYLSSMGDILKIDRSFNHGFDPFIDDYNHPMALASFLVEILMKLVCFIEFSGDFAALGAEFIMEYIGAAHVKDCMHMLAQLSAARALATALVSFSLVVGSYAHSLIIDATLRDIELRFRSTSPFWERKKMLVFLCYCFNVMTNRQACFGFIIAWRMILGDKDLFKEWGMSRPNAYTWAFGWAY